MENQQRKPTPSEQEKREQGIAENERANYSSVPSDSDNGRDKKNRDSDIRETDDVHETDTGASDLAGTASGNLESDDLPDEDE